MVTRRSKIYSGEAMTPIDILKQLEEHLDLFFEEVKTSKVRGTMPIHEVYPIARELLFDVKQSIAKYEEPERETMSHIREDDFEVYLGLESQILAVEAAIAATKSANDLLKASYLAAPGGIDTAIQYLEENLDFLKAYRGTTS